MKKLSVRFVFLVFACLFFVMIPALLTAESLECNLGAGEYRLIQTGTQKFKIDMSSAGYSGLGSPGDPDLPEKIIELKVPQDGDISNIALSINNTDSAVLPQSYDIVSASPAMSDSGEYWGEGKSIVKGKNQYVYGKNAFFPGKTVELLPTVTKKELVGREGKKNVYKMVRYIRFAFRPFAYNPMTRQLQLTKAASVTVSYDVADKVSLKRMGAPAAEAADYVIITTKQTVSESGMLGSFVKMKEAAGHAVRVVTEDDYGSLAGQAPNGTAEKIRQWLIDNYLELGIDYVLLIGDPRPADPLSTSGGVGDLPMKTCCSNILEMEDRVGYTDFFYADLVGNWDLDGDGLYGENFAADHPISPSPTVGSDEFSARWTGKIQFDADAGYYLAAFSDDGARVYLDGDPTPIVDHWTDHLATYKESSSLKLTAGLHDITIEYYKNDMDGILKLLWYSYDTGLKRNVVPADHLYHYDSVSGTYVSGGLDVAYYNSLDLSGNPAYSDVRIANDVWMTGDNGPGGRQPAAQVSVGRIPLYYHDFASLDDILAKIILYETDPASLEWRKSVLLPTYPLDDKTPGYVLGEAVKSAVTDPLGYKSFRIYNEDYAPTGPTPELWPCTVENVAGEWDNHYGLVSWFTHGSASSAVNVMTRDEAEKLSNDYPAFTFQASCMNGDPRIQDNLGYALLRHGAIATVSASQSPLYAGGRTTIGDPTDTMCENAAYFFTKFLMDNGGSPLAVGDALNQYRMNLKSMGREVVVYNVYGDPDCRLFTTTPRTRPVAMLSGPYSCNEGGSVTLDASGSYDPAGGALQYQWDTDGDGEYDTDWSSSPTHTATFNQFTIAYVRVKVDIGVTAWTTASVVVSNLPPVAEAGPDQTVVVNTPITFNGSVSDPGDDIEKYEWDFGDGSPAYSVALDPNNTYTALGTYTVTLTVWDEFGAVASDTCTIKVVAAPFNPLSNEFPARPWTKKQGGFTLSNDTGLKSEGTLSLKLAGTGYMVVATTVFASNELAGYSNQLSLDVYMPSPATNPWWLGQVQLLVTCPSAGIYNQLAGQADLNGLGLDTWNTIKLSLPQNIVNLFAGNNKDIQIGVAVNTNQAAGNPYRIDNLRFTGTIIVPTPTPSAKKVENVWSATSKTATYLTLNGNSEDAKIMCQVAHADWSSQDWIVEPVSGYADRVRLKNKWTGPDGSSYYLTVGGTSGGGEGDPVTGKALRAEWASQIWIVESGRNGSSRLKSAWSNSTYLTVKTTDDGSAVVCQTSHPDWASQEWKLW